MAVAPEHFENARDGAGWLDPDDVSWFGPDERRPWAYRPYGPVMSPAPGRRHLRLVPDAADDPLAVDAVVIPFPAPLAPTRPGLPAYRQARRGWSARRKRRFLARFVPTATVLFSAAVAVPWLSLRSGTAVQKPPRAVVAGAPATPLAGVAAAPLAGTASAIGQGAESRNPGDVAQRGAANARPASGSATPAATPARTRVTAQSAARPDRVAARRQARQVQITYRDATAVGAPWAGHLHDGVRLPSQGPDWVTWDPALDQLPNRGWRLYGTEQLVRTIVRVLAEYRKAHPDAPRVVVGDLSARGGGALDQHKSHQNGLDVDIYYPRLDHRLEAPTSVDQVDLRLAQDLVDRFVAAGAQFVFVGPNTPLTGPGGVVQKLVNHDNHLHVRIAAR